MQLFFSKIQMKTIFETLNCTCTTAKAWQLQAYAAQHYKVLRKTLTTVMLKALNFYQLQHIHKSSNKPPKKV